MKNNFIFSTAVALTTLLLISSVSASSVRVMGERSVAQKASSVERFKSVVGDYNHIRLHDIEANRLENLRNHNARQEVFKSVKLGVHRDIASESADSRVDIQWSNVAGGKASNFFITSPGAASVRLGIDTNKIGYDTEIRFSSATNVEVFRVSALGAKRQADASGTYWSPVLSGETARVEWFVPSSSIEPTPTSIPFIQVSHIFVDPNNKMDFSLVVPTKNSNCMEDVACGRGELGAAFNNAEDSVARMVFTRPDGVFVCSGSLLNDADPFSQIPYFFSAYHCIRNQSEANTLITFWEHEAPTCGAVSAGQNIQRAGGAELLYAESSTDGLLVRLYSTPPSSAFFSGWDSATTIPGVHGLPIIGIHHPGNGNKRFSVGLNFQNGAFAITGGQPIDGYLGAMWTRGATAPGSSGSPVFTRVNATGELLFRGALIGGSSSCATVGMSPGNGNSDIYSRFDLVFPSIRQWISNTSLTPSPTRDYTGAWHNPNESGWGLMITQHPGQLFSLFFAYDETGSPVWYQFQGVWTGPNEVTANVLRQDGRIWNSSGFNASAARTTVVGTATLRFVSGNNANLTVSIPGVINRSVSLTKLE